MNLAGGGRGEAERAPDAAGEDSVTRILPALKRGCSLAEAEIWDRYFEKLLKLARRKLDGMPWRMMDEEDVANSVFKSLCLRARRGDFAQLDNRDDLWRLLATITQVKVAEAVRAANRKKRSFRKLREVSLEQHIASGPSPEVVAILNEQWQRLNALLPDDACRKIALWKMEGYTDEEIAGRLEVTDRTVRRKMTLIRAVWGEELGRGYGATEKH